MNTMFTRLLDIIQQIFLQVLRITILCLWNYIKSQARHHISEKEGEGKAPPFGPYDQHGARDQKGASTISPSLPFSRQKL